MEYRYFTGKKDSKFRTLSGGIQRAIETQVNIELEARKRSKYLGVSFDAEGIKKYFFDNKCEKYANSDDTVLKKLKILDSKYLYLFPLTKDRTSYWESLAEEQANALDRSIDLDQKLKFQSIKGRGNVER